MNFVISFIWVLLTNDKKKEMKSDIRTLNEGYLCAMKLISLEFFMCFCGEFFFALLGNGKALGAEMEVVIEWARMEWNVEFFGEFKAVSCIILIKKYALKFRISINSYIWAR